MWDPTARREPVTRELECSRDENGKAQATVELTPWGTRERLAYQDGAMDAVKMSIGEDGKASMRRVSPSAIALLHLRLTVTGCTGFPDGFSWSSREDVESLDPDVYDEVLAHATEVQPMSGARVKRPDDRKVKRPAGEPLEDFEGGDVADPTPTRSTRGARPRR